MSYQPYPGGPSYGSPPGGPSYGGFQDRSFPQQLPPTKRRTWLWLVGLGILLGLLLIGGCSYLVYRGFSGPFGAAADFAIDLEEGDNRRAYDRLCTQSRAEISFPEFQAEYVPENAFEEINVDSAPFTESGDNTSFIGIFRYVDGTSENVSYDLVNEDGDWRVCNPGQPQN